MFEFDWRSPALARKMGAAYATELPFVFDTLRAASGPNGLLGQDPRLVPADSLHSPWLSFASQGALPWPEYHAASRQAYLLAREALPPTNHTPATAFLP